MATQQNICSIETLESPDGDELVCLFFLPTLVNTNFPQLKEAGKLDLEEFDSLLDADQLDAIINGVKPAAGLRAHLTEEEGVRSEACRDT
jgi:hypothetical protein